MRSDQTGYRAVLLNDTSYSAHHGSRHVVAVIRDRLAARGIAITASMPSGAQWDKDPYFLGELVEADLIVVNGEGTIHHGAAAGSQLLQIVNHPLRRNLPIAFVNMLWQENPDEWASVLKGVNVVAVRDGRSQRSLCQFGIDADFCPDFSFYISSYPRHKPRDRARIVFGDSVYPNISKVLLKAYKRAKGPKLYLPIRARQRHVLGSIKLSTKQRLDIARHNLRATFNACLDGNRVMARDTNQYISALSECGLHITGRYHAICFSIATHTPFRAIASNSHKIEALIEDVGLNPERVVRSVDDALEAGLAPFSDQERKNIGDWLVKSKEITDKVFSSISYFLPEKSAQHAFMSIPSTKN